MTATSDFLGIMYIIPMVFGMGGGMLAGLFIYGLLGGLIGILLYKRKILKLPNYKISAFAGYLVFTFFLLILPVLLTSSFYRDFISLFLPFLHIIIILIFLTLFEKKKVIKSLYWSFVLSYLLGCFALGIFGIFFFLGGSLPGIAF